jgi:O-antigen ligase/tetratricopeptide (TPR) repeat protein
MKDFAKGIAYLGIFAIPFIPLIISNSMFFPFITGKNFTFRVIVEVIFAAWIILACYDAQYRPKFSWIALGFTALLTTMAFSNVLGPNPEGSFWSNFERMEGYVTLVHVFLYMLVAGSMLTTERLWTRFFNTTVIASTLLAFYAFGQLSGDITINQGGARLDGTLGNSAYMAIYALFHIFIGAYLFSRAKTNVWRAVYGAFVLLFFFFLMQTETRGTILGLVGGIGVAMTYMALFTKGHPQLRKIAIGSLVTLLVLVGLFVTFRNSSFIQNVPELKRIASISLSEGNVRFKIWDMAYEGFKERPLIGWGQSNFSYIFNQKYDPSLYFAESWYDRSHDIFFDWLVTGGILGFVAYFSIYLSALYYLFLRPLMRKDESFTVTERGILLGLLVGYLIHNVFVFDNIVSYIFYGTILAFIHSRVSTPIPAIASVRPNERIIEQVIAPVVAVAMVLVVYVVNVPGIKAAGDIIKAFQATTPETMLTAFDVALSRDSFGNQEIREQMTRRAQEVIFNKETPQEVKDELTKKVEGELLKQIEEKPGDARAHVFIASFYRSLGTPESLDKAATQLERARELSPKKQQIIFEQGLVYLQKQDNERMYEYFKEAYELDTTYKDARVFYAMAGIATGRFGIIDEVITDEQTRDAFYINDLIVQVAYTAKQYKLVADIFAYRIIKNPQDPQLRTNLAYILNESGDTAGAIEILKKAGEEIPTFKEQADQFMAEIVKQNLETVE